MNSKGILAASIAVAGLVSLAACKGARPLQPKRPIPAGTYQARFTRRIKGPLELTIDGSRVPVVQKAKKARTLTVSGLSEGTHTYFLFCPSETVGPDFGEIEMGAEGGVFQVHFSQRLKVAYSDRGRTAGAPQAGGPGQVAAVLE